MHLPRRRTCIAVACLFAALSALAQQPISDPAELVASGRVERDGRIVNYRIQHLPVSSFPDLPRTVSAALNDLECTIPQTYQAHRPENVIHGSFESRGSSDWAVLCSAHGKVSLLVFFDSAAGKYQQLASFAETQRLQPRHPSGEMGFDWAIDAASPDTVRQAQIGLTPRPRRLDHDAVANTVIDQRTQYHFYAGSWILVDLPD